ncbi:hypothetical protein Tco_0119500, partial [Tanacetum coccineum]
MPQDLVINKLQKKGKRLEKALRARTPGMKLFKIGTSRDKENVSKQGRKSDKTKPMFKDSDFDGLDDDMENIKEEAVYAATFGVSTARPTVSTTGPSTSVVGASTSILEIEIMTIADTLIAI